MNLYTISFFTMGLIFGSFYNVVGLRLPKKESIIYPGSHCPHCRHFLTWYELIPVFSFLLLKGHCKECGGKISPIYPLIELVTGIFFALSYLRFGLSWEFLLSLLLLSLLVIISVSDLAYMVIPDKVLIFFLLFFLVCRFFQPLQPWWDSLAGALMAFGLLYFLSLISKGGMGGGDMKLYFVLGFFLGIKLTLLSLFLSSLFGILFGLFRKFKRKDSQSVLIPFGPFIALGTQLSFLYGDRLLDFYFRHFFS